jgi:hypothetical protein
MSGSEDAHKLLRELESNMAELPMHLYILIWSVSEMDQRFRDQPANPEFDKICYPFTGVPLFNKKEGNSLADLWRKNVEPNKGLFNNPPQKKRVHKQSGGKPLTLSAMKDKAAQFGQAINFTFKALDPKLLSPDYLFDYTTELFDTVDAGLTDAASTFGLVALESTTPDPAFIIPTIPPVPVIIPARTVLPVINAILEAIRIALSVAPYVDPLGIGSVVKTLVTLIMVLMDLGRGNLYHAIFTSFGLFGTTPMFIGIALKIMRDAIMLVSPDIRTELRYVMFQSSKSMVLGFAIWLFSTLSPQFVKAPLRALFDSVAIQLDTINQQLNVAEAEANLSPAGTLATIKLPRIPGDKIPDINNLYALREAIREPAIFCDPKISDLMAELRGVPPYALFFDLAMLPAPGTANFAEQCAPYKGKSVQDNLTALAAPQIIPKQLALPGLATAPLALPGLAAAPLAAAAAAPALNGAMSSLKSIATDPKAAAMGALASSSPLGALAVQAATDPKAAALGALASSSPLGALAAQAATDPKAAALGALASSSPLGALAAQAATDPKAAALGALASSSPLGALAVKAATLPRK